MRRSLRLAEDTQQTRADVKVLQKEVRDLSAKTERETLQARHAHELDVQRLQSQLDRQQDEMQRLREALHQSREREDTMRKLLLTEVENHLLKASRQLPPAPRPADEDAN